jgi:hypothetical protein
VSISPPPVASPNPNPNADTAIKKLHARINFFTYVPPFKEEFSG